MRYLKTTGAVLCFILLFVSSVPAKTASDSWVNINFTLCEGIGLTGTGRIQGHAIYEKTGSFLKVTSLTFSTTGYQHSHVITGTVDYKGPNGNQKTVTLSNPWFSVIKENSLSNSLYLPRDSKKKDYNDARSQKLITVEAGTAIDVSINLSFSTDGGNCQSSFSTSWQLE